MKISEPPQPLDLSVDPVKEAEYKEEVRRIVLQAVEGLSCRVFLFGSRVEGAIRRSSDFDIGIEKLDKDQFWKVRMRIQEAVEESRVPHEVDVVHFDTVDETFRRAVGSKVEVWKDA